MSKQYDAIAYILRGQPFHNAHLKTIEHAAALARKVVVIVGSINQPRDGDNPFTFEERSAVIRAATKHIDAEIVIRGVENSIYNNTAWAVSVSRTVADVVADGASIKLIGHSKDESSFYLKMFPQWGAPIQMPLIEVLDATTIRKMYFGPKCNLNFFKGVLPQATLDFLEEFKNTEAYQYVCFEVEYIENYRKPYSMLPYPVSFNTGDAVVFKSGHVLLVRRKSQPGQGLWAFPGGFLNAERKVTPSGKIIEPDATLLDCAVRELYEETKIKVPEAVIRGNIREEKEFSAVKRSRRGRIITVAQLIVLPDDDLGLPKVKGADDAEIAKFVPFHEVQRRNMFEDHYDIFKYFEGRVGK